MSDRIKAWADSRVDEMAKQIRSLIDSGMDYESSIDYVFDNSILSMPYKMRALEAVGNYRHEHKFILDTVTGLEWCATCQTFKED